MRHGADLVPLPAGLRGSAQHIVARCLTRDVDLFAKTAPSTYVHVARSACA
jgi:hypothetical protein